MQLNKLPRVHKENFSANDVTGCQFVTSEAQADVGRPGVVRRQYQASDTVLDELLDVLCLLLSDGFEATRGPADLIRSGSSVPTCFSSRHE